MTLPRDRRGRLWLILLVAIAALALAALQGGRASGAAATASGAKSVDIDHFAYHPPTLQIARGGKVAFTNSSNTAHTASGAGFDTKRIKPGKTVVVRFGQKGTFAYHC